MSQDNENTPGDSDFDFNAGTPFNDDNFDPFAEDGFNFGDPAPETPVESAPLDGLADLPGPSPFLTGEAGAEATGGEDIPAGINLEKADGSDAFPVAEEETDAKGKKKKKKEKAKKEKKPKPEKKKKEKKPKEPGDKEPVGIGGTMCLVFGFLLLLGLIGCNVLLLMSDAKAIGVGATSVMYYLIGMDIIGLIGVVSVPFLFFLYRKDIDVFKVGLGLSAMAMSVGVIFLMTALFRYDFVIEASKTVPSTDIPVSAAPAAPAAE